MRFHIVAAALAIAVSVAGCTTAPIHNVDQAAAVNASGKTLTHDQVRGAIVRAGAALGWQMKDEGPNTLVGTIALRGHSAVVTIPYSTTAYSIKYRSSENLQESGGKIHKNYNGWIQNLHRGIAAQLAAS
ncbi:hypothetical protein [Ramlibacter sp. PS4R-6]|uniref:hypothetical protein n=1 Tax=Ramlibacter sp. PS4R-6 TaxID=3133438 RepID=UPI0030A52598